MRRQCIIVTLFSVHLLAAVMCQSPTRCWDLKVNVTRPHTHNPVEKGDFPSV